jgi:hypothetical protein
MTTIGWPAWSRLASQFQVPGSELSQKLRAGEASARSRCAIALFGAVPGNVHRWKTSRLRRLPVLAVGAHPWIGNGEPLEGAVHLARASAPCEDVGWALATSVTHRERWRFGARQAFLTARLSLQKSSIITRQSSIRLFQVPGSRFQVPSSKFQVPSSKFQVPSSKFQVPSSKFQVPSSKFQVPSSKFQEAGGIQAMSRGLSEATPPSNGSPLPIHRWAPTARTGRRRKRLAL